MKKMIILLKSTLTELLQQLQQVDAHAEIKCWKSINNNWLNLSVNSPMPKTLQDMRNYLNKLFFPKKHNQWNNNLHQHYPWT